MGGRRDVSGIERRGPHQQLTGPKLHLQVCLHTVRCAAAEQLISRPACSALSPTVCLVDAGQDVRSRL